MTFGQAMLPVMGLLFANYVVHRNPALVGKAPIFALLVLVDALAVLTVLLWPNLPPPFTMMAARGLIALLLLMHIATAIQSRVSIRAAESRERVEAEYARLRAQLDDEEEARGRADPG